MFNYMTDLNTVEVNPEKTITFTKTGIIFIGLNFLIVYFASYFPVLISLSV